MQLELPIIDGVASENHLQQAISNCNVFRHTHLLIEYVLDDATSVTQTTSFESADKADDAIFAEMNNPEPRVIQVKMSGGVYTFQKSRVVYCRHTESEVLEAMRNTKAQQALNTMTMRRGR